MTDKTECTPESETETTKEMIEITEKTWLRCHLNEQPMEIQFSKIEGYIRGDDGEVGDASDYLTVENLGKTEEQEKKMLDKLFNAAFPK